MLLWVPTSQSKTSLSRLVLEILRQNLAGLCIGNIIGIVVLIQKMTVVLVTVLVVGRDVIIIGVVGLQMILLGLCNKSIRANCM